MDRTDARYVRAEIDLFWIASGVSNDPAIMLDIVNRYKARLFAFHVKDGINPTPTAGTGNLRALGDGAVNFAPIFAAAKNSVKYYLYEYDPVTPGNNGGFNPFTTSDRSFAALTGDPAPVAGTTTPSFASVAAGTAARPTRRPSRSPTSATPRWSSRPPLRRSRPTPTTAAPRPRATSRSSARTAPARRSPRPRPRWPTIPPRGRQRGGPRRPGRHLHDQRRLQAVAHELHVGRAPAVRVQLRRRHGARAAGRHEHRRRHRHRRRQRPEHARAEPADPAGQLRHLRADRRPHLRDRGLGLRHQHRRRRRPVGHGPEHRRSRVTSSTARSRCRPRSTCGRSTRATRRRRTCRWPRPPAPRRTC